MASLIESSGNGLIRAVGGLFKVKNPLSSSAANPEVLKGGEEMQKEHGNEGVDTCS